MANSELRKRVISALALIPLGVGAVWLGGHVFSILLVIIAGLMAWEMGRLVFEGDMQLPHICLMATTSIVLLVHFFFHPLLALTLFMFGLGCGLYLAIMREAAIGWCAFSYLFCVLPVLGLSYLRADGDYGLICVIWLFLCVWATDICAYFVGRALGGPKLAPRFSPNKTWSGLGGGMLGAAICGAILAFALNLSLLHIILLSAFFALVAQGGDLLESHLKRRAGVKDSSALIPGHGGVLDRLDGLIAVSFVAGLIGLLRGGFDQTAGGLISWV